MHTEARIQTSYIPHVTVSRLPVCLTAVHLFIGSRSADCAERRSAPFHDDGTRAGNDEGRLCFLHNRDAT